MSALVIFWISGTLLVEVQDLVKRHNMRFRNNPAAFLEQSTIPVEVEYDGNDAEVWQGFRTELELLRMRCYPVDPPEQVREPSWLELILQGLFK